MLSLLSFSKTAVIIQTKVRQTQCRLVLQHKKRDRQLYYAATCLQKRYRGVQGRIQARKEIEKQQRLIAIEKEKQRQLKRMEEEKRKMEENRIKQIERNKLKIIQRKEKEKKERIETEKKQEAMKQREIEAQLIEREWKKRLVADKKLKREQLKNQKLLDDISRKETEEAYTAFLNEQKSKSTPTQKKKKKINTSSTTTTKDTNTYLGTLLLDNTIQVFWPSRVCNYQGVITTVLPSSATNGMVYKIKYNFDNSIRTYEEKELRKNIYNSYRFVMFMNRFINSISNAITNQRTIFGVTITSFDDLFQALDRNRDGAVDSMELSNVLVRLGVLHSSNSNECTEFLSLIDVDQSGCIDIHELKKVVKHEKKATSKKKRNVRKKVTQPIDSIQTDQKENGTGMNEKVEENDGFFTVRFTVGEIGMIVKVDEDILVVKNIIEGAQADLHGVLLQNASIVSIANHEGTNDVDTVVEYNQLITSLKRPIFITFERDQTTIASTSITSETIEMNKRKSEIAACLSFYPYASLKFSNQTRKIMNDLQTPSIELLFNVLLIFMDKKYSEDIKMEEIVSLTNTMTQKNTIASSSCSKMEKRAVLLIVQESKAPSNFAMECVKKSTCKKELFEIMKIVLMGYNNNIGFNSTTYNKKSKEGGDDKNVENRSIDIAKIEKKVVLSQYQQFKKEEEEMYLKEKQAEHLLLIKQQKIEKIQQRKEKQALQEKEMQRVLIIANQKQEEKEKALLSIKLSPIYENVIPTSAFDEDDEADIKQLLFNTRTSTRTFQTSSTKGTLLTQAKELTKGGSNGLWKGMTYDEKVKEWESWGSPVSKTMQKTIDKKEKIVMTKQDSMKMNVLKFEDDNRYVNKNTNNNTCSKLPPPPPRGRGEGKRRDQVQNKRMKNRPQALNQRERRKQHRQARTQPRQGTVHQQRRRRAPPISISTNSNPSVSTRTSSIDVHQQYRPQPPTNRNSYGSNGSNGSTRSRNRGSSRGGRSGRGGRRGRGSSIAGSSGARVQNRSRHGSSNARSGNRSGNTSESGNRNQNIATTTIMEVPS